MQDAILQQVKATVRQIDPQAEVILFGSRARGDARRGDARPDSDWDFLVLTSYPLNSKNRYLIVDAVFEQVELVVEEVITLIMHEKAEWYDKYSVTPLFQCIREDGITV